MDWIRESNLIEDVDDPKEDARSLRAWKWFLGQSLFLDTIREVHKKIMRVRLKGLHPGTFRVCNVRVGYRVCPPWDHVPGLMSEWILRWGGSAQITHLYSWANRTKEAHVEFEKIHPFVDGNGRTGRMIMNWQRVKMGLEPLCIKASERRDYYRWFE